MTDTGTTDGYIKSLQDEIERLRAIIISARNSLEAIDLTDNAAFRTLVAAIRARKDER